MHSKTLHGTIRWKAKLLGIGFLFLLGVGVTATDWQQAQASFSWMTKAEAQYPTIVGTPLDDCSLCHTSTLALNSYGSSFKKNNNSFTAIQNLDSDGDGYNNLVEINALTFPGDLNSHPVAAPTATPVPPTATRTPAPPTATSTNTRVPPSATPTNTPVPATATSTATRVPPTATSASTLPPPTATMTRGAPTATSTPRPPTVSSTSLAPTATRTRTTVAATKTPPKTVSPTHPVVFRDEIRRLPSRKNLIGDWRVGKKTVHVTSHTRISRDHDDAVKLGMPAVVKGNMLSDGSIDATAIKVREDGVGEKFREWMRELRERLRRLKGD